MSALCSSASDTASTPGSRRSAAVSSDSITNVCPSRGVSVRSASKCEFIDRTSCSKPLKTDSRTIIAATGTATDTTLTPAIRLITEWDFFEKK